jgi:hypothetical protein
LELIHVPGLQPGLAGIDGLVDERTMDVLAIQESGGLHKMMRRFNFGLTQWD